MNKRDIKLLTRIIVLAVTALVLGLGAAIVVSEGEVAKVLPQSRLRDMLIFLAPIASLMTIHYTLAVKSFGMRSLQTEGCIFLFYLSVFLMVLASLYFGADKIISETECPWWRISNCSKTTRVVNYWLVAFFSFCAIFSVFFALRNEIFAKK